MEKVTRYKCDYCNKVFANKSYCKQHECNCFHNPQNKACITCDYGNAYGSCYSGGRCKKTGKALYQRFSPIIKHCPDWEEIVIIERRGE